MAFPQIMLALVAVAVIGPAAWVIVVAIALTTVPRIARVARGAALPVVERDFIACAEAMGVPRWRILFVDLLPNTLGPLMVEASLRMTYSIGVIAALAYLGLAPDPNGANWGTMIQREPARAGRSAVGSGRADRRDRLADHGNRPDRRRHRQNRGGHRPLPGCRMSAPGSRRPDGGGRSSQPAPRSPSATCGSRSPRPGRPWSATSRSRSRQARSSASSASPGQARPPSGLALLGHARRGLAIAGGSVLLGGRDILALSDEQLRRLRARSCRTSRRTPPPR